MSKPKDLRHALPIGFRGYDRERTERLVQTIADEVVWVKEERDELRAQLDKVTRELEEHRQRTRAVADALVSAQQVAADVRAHAEAELAEQESRIAGVREQAEAEATEVREQARHDATEIVRESRLRADRVIDDVADALTGYRADTDHYLDDARQKLDTLVQSVLERIPASAAPAPVELEVPAETPEAEADEPPADAVVAA
jgi:cell division septum initiation protein DivIVA